MVAASPISPSMNAASEKDPFNNNCYGTLVDRPYKTVHLPILDVTDFNERIIRGYEDGTGDRIADIFQVQIPDQGAGRVQGRCAFSRAAAA